MHVSCAVRARICNDSAGYTAVQMKEYTQAWTRTALKAKSESWLVLAGRGSEIGLNSSSNVASTSSGLKYKVFPTMS